MIDKWLKAGAVEDGLLRRTTEGSPQGGVISPCLSNVFLHYVLDERFETVCPAPQLLMPIRHGRLRDLEKIEYGTPKACRVKVVGGVRCDHPSGGEPLLELLA